jgi:hypothetical protein
MVSQCFSDINYKNNSSGIVDVGAELETCCPKLSVSYRHIMHSLRFMQVSSKS